MAKDLEDMRDELRLRKYMRLQSIVGNQKPGIFELSVLSDTDPLKNIAFDLRPWRRLPDLSGRVKVTEKRREEKRREEKRREEKRREERREKRRGEKRREEKRREEKRREENRTEQNRREEKRTEEKR
ncbi:hypothetical protein TURU_152039 [Turdus rufiventris]|nr:hypothetical protein TURU_152039 [Turdus rufiventris]